MTVSKTVGPGSIPGGPAKSYKCSENYRTKFFKDEYFLNKIRVEIETIDVDIILMGVRSN